MCVWGIFQPQPFGGGLGGGESPLMVTKLFAVVYCVARFLITPPVFLYIVLRVTRGIEKDVHVLVKLMWLTAVVAVMGGSIDFGKMIWSKAFE